MPGGSLIHGGTVLAVVVGLAAAVDVAALVIEAALLPAPALCVADTEDLVAAVLAGWGLVGVELGVVWALAATANAAASRRRE